jgi:hypothetical protein
MHSGSGPICSRWITIQRPETFWKRPNCRPAQAKLQSWVSLPDTFGTGLRNQVFGRRMWLFRAAESLKSAKLSIQASENLVSSKVFGSKSGRNK